MKTKFSLSILLLLVLFTTNLSCRLSNQLIKTTTSYSEISNDCFDIVPLDLLNHLILAPEVRVTEFLMLSPSLQWEVLDTSLNPLYLATPPPVLS